MPENKRKLSELFAGKSIDEIAEIIEDIDLSDYEDEMPVVQFTVSPNIKRSRKLTEEEKESIRKGGPIPSDLCTPLKEEANYKVYKVVGAQTGTMIQKIWINNISPNIQFRTAAS